MCLFIYFDQIKAYIYIKVEHVVVAQQNPNTIESSETWLNNLLIFVMFDSADGLKYYDLDEGKGPIAEKGSTVQV